MSEKLGITDLYEITSTGKVYSYQKWRGQDRRELKQFRDKYGYLKVRLTVNGIRKKYSVHRLVALNHVDGYFIGAEVRHLDGNKLNNDASNLKWGTTKENAKDRMKNGTSQIGSSHSQAKITESQANKVKSMLKKGYKMSSISTALDVSYYIVNDIKRGRSWGY
jgi:hypothetical protein